MPFKIFSSHGCTVSESYPTYKQILTQHFTDQVWITRVEFDEISTEDLKLVERIQQALTRQ
ncbi:MAG: hypothetical protein ACFBSC_07950 [Microcoleaceae cyanobacterium]